MQYISTQLNHPDYYEICFFFFLEGITKYVLTCKINNYS